MACEDSGAEALSYGQAIRLRGNDPFGGACKLLLDNNKIKPRYDLILIDEGQDLRLLFINFVISCLKQEDNLGI